MRILALTGVLAAVAVLPLGAQRGHQFEVGAFGSYTRDDRAFNLNDQSGGGGRPGDFFRDVSGVELEAGYPSPPPRARTSPGAPPPTLRSATRGPNRAGRRT